MDGFVAVVLCFVLFGYCYFCLFVFVLPILKTYLVQRIEQIKT